MKFRNAAAAVLVLLVVLGAILAGTALSGGGSDSGSQSAADCSDRGWAATASGKPAALTGTRSFYVWRGRTSWNVWARASSSAPVTAKVQADARLRVLRFMGARPTLGSRARTLTFRVATSRLSGVAFRAACATRLSFQLGAAQAAPVAPAGAASPIPGSQGSTPRVFLGATGQAPANAFRLQRPATTGIAGRILVSTPCRGGPGACPPPKPARGTVRIETAPAQKGVPGQVVTRVRSDENGNYSVQLEPGRYQLVVEKAAGYPVAKATIAEVEAGVVTQVDLYLDSGIR